MLESEQKPLKSVSILNDSVWLPLNQGTKLLETLDVENLNFAGLVRKTKYKQDVKANQETPGFIEAYFYHIGELELAPNSTFWRFWPNAYMTKGRKNLREGAISNHFTKNEKTFDTIASRFDFLNAIQQQSDAFLFKTLSYCALVDPEHINLGTKLQQSYTKTANTQWRNQTLELIEDVVKNDPFYATFIYATLMMFDLPFLKKSNSHPAYKKMRACYINAVNNGDLPKTNAIIFAEICKQVQIETTDDL